ncbi:chaplin [Streptomyces sp. NPDC003077]|uniref:chaplin n=1 Tax=Streptomyces sp. NPDC003077 TaxID=3154443 RepID=UPI0033B86D20
MRIRTALTAASLVAAGIAGATGAAVADSGSNGVATGSPGIISGNTVQVPIHLPVAVCGNTLDIIGLLNPAEGDACVQH